MHLLNKALLYSCLIPHASAQFGEAPYSLTLERDILAPKRGQEIQVLSSLARASVPLTISTDHIMALNGSYEHFFYDKGESTPFDQLSQARLSLFSLTKFKNNWNFISISTLQSSRELDIPLDRAFSLSGIYGSWFSGWERLTLGAGIGFSTKLSDQTSFFPLILLDWEFTENWHLTTRPTPGTRFGPGISLAYLPDHPWSLYAGGRYINNEFQLKGEALYAYNTSRLFATLQYNLSKNLTCSCTIGMNVKGELKLNHSTLDLDQSMFGAIDLSWNF